MLNKILKNHKKSVARKDGFVILFAIVLASIILSIAIGVTDIAFKEVVFSTSTKATNEAFFAADTGYECARYYFDQFGLNPNNVASARNVWCAGNHLNLYTPGPSGPWDFVLVGLGGTYGNPINSLKSCAKVHVTKDAVSHAPSIIMTINSKGYNTGGDTVDCTSSDPSRVERELQIQFEY